MKYLCALLPLIICTILVLFVACSGEDNIPIYGYEVVNQYTHDSNAFTQGLVFDNGVLYEGTGRWGYSSIRKVDVETGEVLQIYDLPQEYFGEGMTIIDDKIIQLTWQSRVGFIYDKNSFELQKEFHYASEGWGITYDGKYLIMSDGTSTLRFWDPITFEEICKIQVRDDKGPVINLNELEYVNGEIFANVWKTDRIARINPNTGDVVGWIYLEGILNAIDLSQPVDVLNGIAYDFTSDRLFVTGKLWPTLFEIKIIAD